MKQLISLLSILLISLFAIEVSNNKLYSNKDILIRGFRIYRECHIQSLGKYKIQNWWLEKSQDFDIEHRINIKSSIYPFDVHRVFRKGTKTVKLAFFSEEVDKFEKNEITIKFENGIEFGPLRFDKFTCLNNIKNK